MYLSNITSLLSECQIELITKTTKLNTSKRWSFFWTSNTHMKQWSKLKIIPFVSTNVLKFRMRIRLAKVMRWSRWSVNAGTTISFRLITIKEFLRSGNKESYLQTTRQTYLQMRLIMRWSNSHLKNLTLFDFIMLSTYEHISIDHICVLEKSVLTPQFWEFITWAAQIGRLMRTRQFLFMTQIHFLLTEW